MTTAVSAQPDSNADAARPARPVVVYDGNCRFCLRQIERFKKRDREGFFEYVPRQREGLDERFPVLASGDFNTGLRLIDREGRCHVGAEAIYRIARRLPVYRTVAWLYRVPLLSSLFRAAYRLVAKYRNRLAGKTSCEPGDSCRIDG
ncbi:MAG: DUF393 domain-containing protein [Phycisphaeraceae bacterium]|nr:DUF393 domain-containing protein [Phycisphaeraceae bacterium]